MQRDESHVVRYVLLSLVLTFASCASDDAAVSAGPAGATGGAAGSSSSGGSSNAGASGGATSGAGGAHAGTGGDEAGSGGEAPADAQAGPGDEAGAGADAGAAGGRGLRVAWPWVSWYGASGGAAALTEVAATFRVINIDADPAGGNFGDEEIATLRAGGQNIVLSYLNLGSCENYRSYFAQSPPGHASCQASGALTTPYAGYADEMWADLSNEAYQDLMVNYVAARLVARGVDGFYLDNLEVVEHGSGATNGPCNGACSQGGLDLVWKLRQKFPDKLIVMQNASSDVTRRGMTHGVPFPSILDGVSHEEVYGNGGDSQALAQMKAWRDMHLVVNGQPFWLAVEDYVGACSSAQKPAADAIYARGKADGFHTYVTDESGSQTAPCFWGDL
jgi:cysteinyl-tRNA synthetase